MKEFHVQVFTILVIMFVFVVGLLLVKAYKNFVRPVIDQMKRNRRKTKKNKPA